MVYSFDRKALSCSSFVWNVFSFSFSYCGTSHVTEYSEDDISIGDWICLVQLNLVIFLSLKIIFLCHVMCNCPCSSTVHIQLGSTCWSVRWTLVRVLSTCITSHAAK